jgi:RNA polymerase sigma-70 factor (ECF subfamily)
VLRSELLHVTEHAAWAALRSEVRHFVARRASASEVDDLVQEVLIAVAKAEGARSIGALAHAVARRTVAEHHRRRAREHARLARVALEPIDDEAPVRAAEAALAGALAGFLDEITPAHAEAVRAVDVDGRAQAEVARALGVPLSTLRTRVQRGRAELRERVRRCCEIDLDARGRVMRCEPRSDGDACSTCA